MYSGVHEVPEVGYHPLPLLDRGPTSTPSIASAEPTASGGFSMDGIVLQMALPSKRSWFPICEAFLGGLCGKANIFIQLRSVPDKAAK